MNRRKFFKSLVIGAAAIVVTPKLLISKPRLDGYSVPKPMIGNILPNGTKFITYTDPISGVSISIVPDPHYDYVPEYKCRNQLSMIRKVYVFDERYDSARQSLIGHMKKYHDSYNYSMINLGI